MTTESKEQQLPLNNIGALPGASEEPPFCMAAVASYPTAVNGISGSVPIDITPFVAGRESSPLPAPKIFDDARDNALIQKGTHFFCLGHLTAVPVETQSRNPDYCRTCLDVLEGERRDKDIDTWAGEVFINHNKRYTVHAEVPKGNEPYEVEIKTYCLGDVKPIEARQGIATSLLQTVKVPAPSRTTNPDIVIVNSGKKCLVCGRLITWGNSRAKYCSDPCQKKAHLMRKETVRT
jgi:predicted nucleic acid-binding Zn ribbon protein